MNLNFNWKLALVLVYPIVVAFCLEVFVQEASYSSGLNLLENILFALIILVGINIVLSFKGGRLFTKLLIFFFYSSLFLETALYLVFQTRMNSAYLYVILNTNFAEIKEFSSVYYENNVFWLLLFFVPLFFYSYKIKLQRKKIKNTFVYLTLFIFLITFSVAKFLNLGKWNLLYISFKSYLEYKAQEQTVDLFLKARDSVKVSQVLDNETLVVVIGESTTRNHMGIYGYYRNNTPRLTAMKDSLYVFNEVISSKVFTTGSLLDVLTLSNYENTKNAKPLIRFFKDSGYKVYWISNQRPVGLNDNMVAKLASEADESKFFSYNDYRHNTPYDDVLFPLFQEKLSKKEKKVIFLHLIGTHYDYKKRYPEKFSKYSSLSNETKEATIDAYDNAILYNDFVVSEIIKKVSLTLDKSAVVYFSDHGEELYGDEAFFGHFQDKPTKSMYEVPFIVYLSKNFEKPTDFDFSPSRKYMLDNFPHSITHLFGLESTLLNQEKSVFSKYFEPRKRIINGDLSFEEYFNTGGK